MNKLMLSFILILAACTPKTPPVVQPDVKVEISSYPNTTRVETVYTHTQGECVVSWQTTADTEGSTLKVYLRNRTDCSRPFQELCGLHEVVLKRVLQDYPPTTISSLGTSGLKSLQPDGSWNDVIAKASNESLEWQDFRKNYPNHKSKLSSNQIMVNLIQTERPHLPFKEMLQKVGLNFEIEGVEKVFNGKNEQGQTIINDAGMIWWQKN
jgi:hypothetical protein